MIKQLLNSVLAKYRDLSVARRSIICLCLRRRQIIDLLATDKSRYFAQPRPIIDNYLHIQLFQLRLSLSKAEKWNTSAKGLLGIVKKFINFFAIPSKPFTLVFDFSALLGDNLN
jgi:hypothetical protein